MSTLPTLALTLGDPAGIGPEIVGRLLAGPPLPLRLLLIGDGAALERERKQQPALVLPPRVAGPEDLPEHPGAIGLLAGARRCEPLPPYGVVSAEAGAACHAWVLEAADLALAGRVEGIVTGPIQKASWHAAGVTSPGHTEALRDRAGVERVLMMLVGGRLRAALATIHVPLSQVSALLTVNALKADLLLLARETARAFGPERPRIAVCGLNPHAGESGLFGSEDDAIIRPAVEAVREMGLDAYGPLPADACIPAAVGGHYDALLAMYHDQALPTVKSIAPRQSVNVTLGLPFVRTSVDHGTAFDIAGEGRATETSLRSALSLCASMVERFREERIS